MPYDVDGGSDVGRMLEDMVVGFLGGRDSQIGVRRKRAGARRLREFDQRTSKDGGMDRRVCWASMMM